MFPVSPFDILQGPSKVSLESSLFQTEPQLSQPLFTAVPSLGWFSWSPSAPAPIGPCLSCARAPELDAGLTGVGQNSLPQPAGHTSFGAAQDTNGFQGLPAHIHLFVH